MDDKQIQPSDERDLPLPRSELVQQIKQVLESRGLDSKDPNVLAQILVEQTISQSTSGLYPPPRMLAEYKSIDERVFNEIVDGARSQREHRQSLEKFATEASIRRQNTADITQNACSIASILIAATLVFSQIWFGQEIHWIFPSILVAVGVGGRPVGTLIASAILKIRGDSKRLRDLED